MGTGEVARPIASGLHASLEAAAAELLELNSVSKEQPLSFVSQLPSDQLRKSSASRVGSVSFSTGAFVHAHVPGIRHNTRIFPNFTKLLCRYVKQACPTFSFTALVILHNLLSDFHRDLNNLPGSLNCVLPLSDFSGGQLWIQDEGGPIQQQVNGRSLSGSLHEVHASPVLFDARSACGTKPCLGKVIAQCLLHLRRTSSHGWIPRTRACWHPLALCPRPSQTLRALTPRGLTPPSRFSQHLLPCRGPAR